MKFVVKNLYIQVQFSETMPSKFTEKNDKDFEFDMLVLNICTQKFFGSFLHIIY